MKVWLRESKAFLKLMRLISADPLLGDGGAHDVDDVDDAASNVVLRGVGHLFFADDFADCWFDSVCYAGTCMERREIGR